MQETDKSQWDDAVEAVYDYLETADLNRVSVGVRNLIFSYLLNSSEGLDGWFNELLEELPGLFDFLDSLQAILPRQ
jgi:hypothetical protein